MRPPLVICAGVIRSGSTWAYNVCREMFGQLAARTNRQVSAGYLDGSQLEEFVQVQWDLTTSMMVLKVHDIGPSALNAVRAGAAKAVCTYRDPRDCVASDMAFMNKSFDVCMKQISGTFENLRMYRFTPHILMIRYEDMMTNRPAEIRRIATHLKINCDDAFIAGIDRRTDLESSKKVCDSLAGRADDQVLTIADHRIDPATHLHSNHINGGTIGRWRVELSAEQIDYATEYFAPWLLRLGYETPDTLAGILKRSIVD
jgi:hypothetical protein